MCRAAVGVGVAHQRCHEATVGSQWVSDNGDDAAMQIVQLRWMEDTLALNICIKSWMDRQQNRRRPVLQRSCSNLRSHQDLSGGGAPGSTVSFTAPFPRGYEFTRRF